jgi:hypothetical protein
MVERREKSVLDESSPNSFGVCRIGISERDGFSLVRASNSLARKEGLASKLEGLAVVEDIPGNK